MPLKNWLIIGFAAVVSAVAAGQVPLDRTSLAGLTTVAWAEETPQPLTEQRPVPVEDEKATPSREGSAAAASPFALSLGLYSWMPAMDAELSSGNIETEIDESLLDLIDATKGVPLAIAGRLELYWKSLGIAVDGNYFNLKFREQDITVGPVAGSGEISVQMAFLEYSAMVRVFGALPADRPKWAVESGLPRVDLYAGLRTIWLKARIEPETLPITSNDETLTSPLVGARVEVDLGPKWFFRLDGNVGGFGVDDIQFAGEGLAVFGLRVAPFHVPTELWLGAQVLYIETTEGGAVGRLETEMLLYGPALGLTFCW